MRELYPSQEALDAALASGAQDGTLVPFDQRDEFVACLPASGPAGRVDWIVFWCALAKQRAQVPRAQAQAVVLHFPRNGAICLAPNLFSRHHNATGAMIDKYTHFDWDRCAAELQSRREVASATSGSPQRADGRR